MIFCSITGAGKFCGAFLPIVFLYSHSCTEPQGGDSSADNLSRNLYNEAAWQQHFKSIYIYSCECMK